jgi:hypothetical protein
VGLFAFFISGEIFMAHLVEQMAYVGQTPWHGLGNALAPRQSIDVWAKQAGMDWEILDSPVRFITSKNNIF